MSEEEREGEIEGERWGKEVGEREGEMKLQNANVFVYIREFGEYQRKKFDDRFSPILIVIAV